MRTFLNDIATACLLFTITRVDGSIEYVTTASRDITIGPTTWTAHPGLKAGARTSRIDGTPPTMGFEVQLGSAVPLKFSDVVKGVYDGARVQVGLTSWENPQEPDFVFDGLILGEIAYDQHGVAAFDLISLFGIERDIFIEKFTLMCRYQFGDWKTCKVPVFPISAFPYTSVGDNLLHDVQRNEDIETGAGSFRRFRFGSDGTPEDYQNVNLEVTVPGTTGASVPAFSATPGAVTVDGTVTFTTRDAYARAARIVSVTNHTVTLDRLPDPRASGNSAWFNPLKFYFASGTYKGRAFMGSGWDSDALTFQVYLPCPFAAEDDWIEIAPQCSLTKTDCIRFGAIRRFGGFPNQVGAKAQAQQLGYA